MKSAFTSERQPAYLLGLYRTEIEAQDALGYMETHETEITGGHFAHEVRPWHGPNGRETRQFHFGLYEVHA